MTRVLRLITCGLCLFSLACVRQDDPGRPDDPLEGVDTLGGDTTIAPEPPQEEVPLPDRMELEGPPTEGVEDEEADTGGAVRPLPPWTIGRVAWDPPESRPPTPVAAELRQGRGEGFDRWVVEFQGAETLPGYRVEYVDRPLHECGSGDQIHPVGDAWLEVRLEPAHGHTEAGRGTLPREVETPALTRGLKVYRTCDFEAIVTLVLALDSPEPFRVFHLTDPARVVVDVRH